MEYSSSKGGVMPGALAAGFLVFLWLAWLALVPMPYEEDGIAKAGKILSMQQDGHILNPLAGRYFYHDEMFSFYYMILGCVHAVLGKNVFCEMNMASAVAGGIFCGLASAALRLAFSIPVWLTALLAVNTPAFNHVFSFGNESAFALAAFALAFFLLTQPTFLKSILSGIVFGLGIHCRPDVIFLFPFLFAWGWINSGAVPRAGRLKLCSCFAVMAGLTALGYWLVFVRRVPTELSYTVTFVPKYFAGMLFYPFAPALMPAAVMGVIHLIRTRSWKGAALLLAFIPLIYCAKGLTSPKYIAILMLPLWVAAGTALIQRGWGIRGLTVALAAMFWMCSLTPFGLHFGSRGTAWFFPTEHGPVPTGSYAWFYGKVHRGAYQQRRAMEINEVEELLRYLEENPGDVTVGFFDSQALLFAETEQPRFESVLENFLAQDVSVPTNHPCLMIKTSYMRLNTLEISSQETLRGWFAAGRVRAAVGASGDPFPDIIETGGQVPVEKGAELGRRILFALDCGRSGGYIRRDLFDCDLNATRWVTAKEIPASSTLIAAYADPDFAAYTNDIGVGVVYSSVMPLRYFGFKDPRYNPHFAFSSENKIEK